jgi:membrane protein required for colicin V production
VVFGVLRGGVIIAILVLLAGATQLPQDPWWRESLLIEHFQEVAIWLRGKLPPEYADKFVYE